MYRPLPRRDKTHGWLIVAAVFFLLVVPFSGSAQLTNQAPQFTSIPDTTVTAGQTYQYQVTSSDADGDSVIYDLSVSPSGLELSNGLITWQPTKAGTYNVIVEADDQNNGFDSQAWQISVAPGTPTVIDILPNERPTVITEGNNKFFLATAADEFGNNISSPDIIWSTDPLIGTIDQVGVFTAVKGGIGFVAATIGEATKSVGIIVQAIPPITTTDQDTADTTDEDTSVDSDTTTDEEAAVVSADTTENDSEDKVVIDTATLDNIESDSSTAMANETGDESEPCTNPNHGFIILMIFGYGLIVLGYFWYEKKNPSPGWWIFPFLLTIIALMIYYKNFCPSTYLWWPWLIVGIGTAITIYYKGRKKAEMPSSDDSQSHLPF